MGDVTRGRTAGGTSSAGVDGRRRGRSAICRTAPGRTTAAATRARFERGASDDPEIPLTERVLDALPGPRWLGIAIWALVPLATPFVARWTLMTTRGGDVGGDFIADRLIAHAGISAAILIAIPWSSRTARAFAAARPSVERVARSPMDRGPLGGMANLVAPVAIAVVFAAILILESVPRFGPLIAATVVPIYAVAHLPAATMLWCYVVVLVSLDRLGRRSIRLHGFPQDRSLGLEPVGSLAFTAFAGITATLVPLLVVAARGPIDVVVGLAVLAFEIALLVLALTRLHGQLVAAKKAHLADARALFAAAYEPVQAAPTLDRLDVQSTRLRTADLILSRAESIHEWPIDQGIVGRIVAISTGVVTALCSTLVLRQLGL